MQEPPREIERGTPTEGDALRNVRVLAGFHFVLAAVYPLLLHALVLMAYLNQTVELGHRPGPRDPSGEFVRFLVKSVGLLGRCIPLVVLAILPLAVLSVLGLRAHEVFKRVTLMIWVLFFAWVGAVLLVTWDPFGAWTWFALD